MKSMREVVSPDALDKTVFNDSRIDEDFRSHLSVRERYDTKKPRRRFRAAWHGDQIPSWTGVMLQKDCLSSTYQ